MLWVAGTTGSGKSGLLQSWCLALASMNGPASEFRVLGFQRRFRVPQTDGCRIPWAAMIWIWRTPVRALRALEAELTRREQLSAAVHASDIRDMVNPPPRLIVVIDEFHA